MFIVVVPERTDPDAFVSFGVNDQVAVVVVAFVVPLKVAIPETLTEGVARGALIVALKAGFVPGLK
jgi:hypothetical protein